MRWIDKFRRKEAAALDGGNKEHIYVINGIDISARKATGYGEIAEVSIKGGSEEERGLLSATLLSMLMPHYDYKLSTSTPDDYTDGLTFKAPDMQSLDGRPIKESATPMLTLDALKKALARMEQKVNLRELE